MALASWKKHLCPYTILTSAIPCTYRCLCGFASGAFRYVDWFQALTRLRLVDDCAEKHNDLSERHHYHIFRA